MIAEFSKAMKWLLSGILIAVILILIACAAPKLHELQHQFKGDTCDRDGCILNGIENII